MENDSRAIYITDMSKCKPQSALTRDIEQGKWRILSYESEGVSGKMIDATRYMNAPQVTLPLDETGWYKIFIGFWNQPFGGEEHMSVRLKLTNDPTFFGILDNQGHVWDRTDLKEAFWKCADLTGQDIIVAQRSKGVSMKANIAYVKLVPMSKEEVEKLQTERSCLDTRKVIAVVDGASYISLKGCTTSEDIKENFERFRYSDIGKVFYAVNYGVTTNYPSKVGLLCGGNGKGFISEGAKVLYESLHSLIGKNIVPFVSAMEHVHEIGREFHIQFRMGLGDDAIQGEGIDGFASKHSEFRIIHKDGTPLPKLSYAFPEVRQFILDLIDEVSAFDIDGINLGFNRGPLFVGYEAPVVDSFIKKFGDDPRKLSDNDPRIIQHKADFITQLVHEIKQRVLQISTEKGKKIKLSAWPTGWTQELNLFHALDVRTWLKRNLIDSIVGIVEEDLLELAKNSGCKIYWGLGAREPESYVTNASKGIKHNADGFTIWDIDINVMEMPEHWEVIKNLGHHNCVEKYAQKLPQIKCKKMLSVNKFDFSHTYGKGAPENWPPEMMVFMTNG